VETETVAKFKPTDLYGRCNRNKHRRELRPTNTC